MRSTRVVRGDVAATLRAFAGPPKYGVTPTDDEMSMQIRSGIMLAVFVSAPLHAQALAGYVWEARGPWFASAAPATPLTKGVGLHAGDRIRPGTPLPAGSAITVILRDGRRLVRNCTADTMRACRQPLVVPSGETGKGVVARIVDAVHEQFAHEPERYASLISRGGEAALDAVVLLRGDSVDLGPVFDPVDAGAYDLCFVPIARDSTPDRAADAGACPTSARYTWNPEKPEAARIAGLRPGLYALRLSDTDRQQAWVLVSDSTHFAPTHASFARASSITDEWQGTKQGAHARSFLRAYLDYLRNNPPSR
ncbi:MAG: hypothetical protein ABI601_04525 [bacterium]